MANVQEQRGSKKLGGVTGKGFKPGQSGNPGGRAKGSSLSGLLRKALEERPRKGGPTNAQIIAEKLIELAKGGDRQAIKDVFERVDGKVPDKLDVTSTATARDLMADLKASAERYERNGTGRPDPDGTVEVPDGPGAVQ